MLLNHDFYLDGESVCFKLMAFHKNIYESMIKIGKQPVFDHSVDLAYSAIQEPRLKEFDPQLIIGDNVIIRGGTTIYIGCKIGNGTMIGHNTVIREACLFGEYCRIGHLTSICGAVTIGDYTSIHDQVHITAHTTIGKHVFIGPRTVTGNDPIMCYHRENIEPDEFKGPTIMDGVRIGAGSLIMPGITIGREAKIGMGTLVLKDVSDYAIVVGHPGKEVGKVPEDEWLENNGIEL